MQVLSINVSPVKVFEYRGRPDTTGIFKTPIDGPVMLRELNIDGDKQADLQAHGGPYKAVYFYPHEHYPYWQAELGRDEPFGYGQFGENLTVTGLLETEVNVGDVFQIGEAQVQVTQPRVPCYKLVHKMNAPRDFTKAFLRTGKVGFYARVLQAGNIDTGPVQKLATDPHGVSIHAINHLLYVDQTDKDLARRALEIEALSPGWRGSMADLLR